MSLEVYLQWFQFGEPVALPVVRLRAAFAGLLNHAGDLTEGELYCSYSSPSEDSTDGITIGRPSTAPRLWNALFELLQERYAVFYFPGSSLFVAESETVDHLPLDMVEALGRPVVVDSPAALQETLDTA